MEKEDEGQWGSLAYHPLHTYTRTHTHLTRPLRPHLAWRRLARHLAVSLLSGR